MCNARVVVRSKQLLAVVLGSVALAAQAWNADENQIWLEAGTTAKVSENVKLGFTKQWRFRGSDDESYYNFSELNATYMLPNSWSVVGRYRYTERLHGDGEWRNDNMGLFDVNKKTHLGPVDLKTRLRFTLADARQTDDDPSDARFRFELLPKAGLTSLKLKPYVANEVMYSLESGRMYFNGSYLGLRAAPYSKVSTNLYVMLAQKEDAARDWNESYVFGGYVTVKF